MLSVLKLVVLQRQGHEMVVPGLGQPSRSGHFHRITDHRNTRVIFYAQTAPNSNVLILNRLFPCSLWTSATDCG